MNTKHLFLLFTIAVSSAAIAMEDVSMPSDAPSTSSGLWGSFKSAVSSKYEEAKNLYHQAKNYINDKYQQASNSLTSLESKIAATGAGEFTRSLAQRLRSHEEESQQELIDSLLISAAQFKEAHTNVNNEQNALAKILEKAAQNQGANYLAQVDRAIDQYKAVDSQINSLVDTIEVLFVNALNKMAEHVSFITQYKSNSTNPVVVKGIELVRAKARIGLDMIINRIQNMIDMMHKRVNNLTVQLIKNLVRAELAARVGGIENTAIMQRISLIKQLAEQREANTANVRDRVKAAIENAKATALAAEVNTATEGQSVTAEELTAPHVKRNKILGRI